MARCNCDVFCDEPVCPVHGRLRADTDEEIVARDGKTCCYFHATGGAHDATCGEDDAALGSRGETL
jgi:hypothetical protein